jgi:tRNA pseudouridine55 synthase
MKLGETSTTGDEEGIKTKTSEVVPAEQEVQATLDSLLGEIQQVPPAFSAIKVGGKRAYKLAREGKEVKLEPRPITIYEITDVTYTYPHVEFTTKVSSGTYIRTLVEDIGKDLGTGAYMTDLRRTQVGKFHIGQSLSLEKNTELSAETIDKMLQTNI